VTAPRAVSATLACGCRLSFARAPESETLTVVVARKSDGCTRALHVTGLPVYDHRAALRPPSRFGSPLQPDYEDG
jgi:hypothetical protein